MNNFNKPEIEVIKFEAKDGIATSSDNDNAYEDAGGYQNL